MNDPISEFTHEHGRKPRILFLADVRGWAFDFEIAELQRCLDGRVDVGVAYVKEEPDLRQWAFDIIAVLFWGETYHQRFVHDPTRILKQVASHRWGNEDRYGRLTAEQFVSTHLRDAGTVTAISRRLHAEILPYRSVFYAPQGITTSRYARREMRKGPMVIGWAGNAADPCKGLKEILRPAAGRDFSLVVAGGDLSSEQMVDFYHSTDILCVASTAEGEPRTLIEGMAAGCFPIVVDVGIVPELVVHRRNGLIVRRSVAAFRAAFQWCQANLAFVRAAGKQNIQWTAANRDITHTFGYWADAISHAIQLARLSEMAFAAQGRFASAGVLQDADASHSDSGQASDP